MEILAKNPMKSNVVEEIRSDHRVKKVVSLVKSQIKCKCRCQAKKHRNSHKKLEDDEEHCETKKTTGKFNIKSDISIAPVKKPSQDKIFLLENVD
ncbi:unnamed protein product [Bursaphelenchus okinawaensis]|uniref:Uncharacterized protein n=1 Tax=Bursaphelenchus okinawaensis TaxID=465554 RepID=A0A811KH89_9BILA|nr:unnamed protein product [Bursaphelenchus okinawaensis]CAG9104482.1 unnamed protein product [Bursaphelenchus okinawaensis]